MSDTEHDAMLRAVLVNPADDHPRLVMADWYDDHGQPERAEFIRVQCELGGRWKAADYHHALRRRERELFARLTGGGLPDDGLPENCVTTIDAINGELRPYGQPFAFSLAFVRRGFVAEVRTTLAVLFGRECGRCGGTGTSEREYHGVTDDDGGCPDCSGTGRTPGVATDLFAAHPIERVVLTDREPEQNAYGGADCSWQSFGHHRDSWIPRTLLMRLPGFEWDGQEWERYPTADAARGALSAAAVAWGRELAGLPPLK